LLEPGECLDLAADPALGLGAPFVRAALARGDDCFAVFDGGDMASFAWYARRPTALPHGLTLYFDDGLVCLYHSHTRPGWRGRGLFSAGVHAALRHYDALDGRGLVAAVEVADDESPRAIRALRRAGFAVFGTVYVGRCAGRSAILHTPGCRRLATRLRRTP
jgi:GNAT superfamily N-acetyltransferase